MRGIAPLFMVIKLCKISDNVNKVNKKVEEVKELTSVKFIDDTSITNPVIRTSNIRDITNLRKDGVNYVHINALGRYYFIKDIVARKNGFVDLYLDVDVLMSFKDDILSSTQIINRAENLITPSIMDESVELQQNFNVANYHIDNDVIYTNHLSFVLKLGGNY